MSPTPLHRALVALAVFTFASWGLITAAIMFWAPGRSLAANAVSRVARAAAAGPSAGSLAAVAMSDLLPCGSRVAYAGGDERERRGFDERSDKADFSWSLRDKGGSGVILDGDGFSGNREFRHDPGGATRAPEFRFRDHGDEYVVHDPRILAEVREATRPLRDMGRQMGDVGRAMGRRGAALGRMGGRLGVLAAKLAELEVRAANGPGSRAESDEIDRLRTEMSELRARLAHDAWNERDRDRLTGRMRELSARHRATLQEVREHVRTISERARREGKAERPHANA